MKDLNGRRRVEFTQEDRDYFTRLRSELAGGPFGMCDTIEYAPLGEDEKRIETLKQKITELRGEIND